MVLHEPDLGRPVPVTAAAPAAGTVLALDQGWTTAAGAEHGLTALLRELGVTPTLACTHVLPGTGRVGVTVEAPALPADLPGAPADAAGLVAVHATRSSGRAFVFAGQAALTGTLPVRDLLARSAVDEVVLLGGAPAAGEALVDTCGFVRPVLADGRLRLVVRPGPGEALVPFEQRHQRVCGCDAD